MPAGPGEEADRFAAAVDSGRPPASYGDDELTRDLEIVAMLRSRGHAMDPDPAAKAAARRKLMERLAEPVPAQPGAPGPELVTEMLHRVPVRIDDDPTPPTVATPTIDPARPAIVVGGAEHDEHDAHTDDTDGAVPPTRDGRGRHVLARSRRPARGARRRPMRGTPVLTSAAMALTLVLAGAGVLASTSALPGDTLYPVKRASETAGLALTFDDAGLARRHLDLASTRLAEVERLIETNPQLPTEQPELVRESLREFDQSAEQGARILLAEHTSDAEVAREDLRNWATRESERLATVRSTLPTEDDPAASGLLLDRLVARAAPDDPTCPDGSARPDRAGSPGSCDRDADQDAAGPVADPSESDIDPSGTDATVTSGPTSPSAAPTTQADAQGADATVGVSTGPQPGTTHEPDQGRAGGDRSGAAEPTPPSSTVTPSADRETTTPDPGPRIELPSLPFGIPGLTPVN